MLRQQRVHAHAAATRQPGKVLGYTPVGMPTHVAIRSVSARTSPSTFSNNLHYAMKDILKRCSGRGLPATWLRAPLQAISNATTAIYPRQIRTVVQKITSKGARVCSDFPPSTFSGNLLRAITRTPRMRAHAVIARQPQKVLGDHQMHLHYTTVILLVNLQELSRVVDRVGHQFRS